MCDFAPLIFVLFIIIVTTEARTQQSDSCVAPSKSADKAFTAFHFNNSLIRSGPVPKGGYINLKCKNGYLFSNGRNTSISHCGPTPKGKWQPAIKPCLRVCPPLKTSNVDLICKYNSREISCENTPLFSGTEVTPYCKDLHRPSQNSVPDDNKIVCRSDGSWDRALIECVPAPDCGVQKHRLLIFGGSNTTLGEFPWHVAIYSIRRGYVLICGGTLIARNIVLSAAHCFYNESSGRPMAEPNDYAIVVGKLTRNYETKDSLVQKRLEILKILFTEKPYKPSITGYFADIVLIVLKERVVTSPYVLPACFKANGHHGFNPGSGEMGLLAGWGVDETDEPADRLKNTKLPYVHYNQCYEKLPGITHDKFCAGADGDRRPGSGDSGGGLVFKDSNNLYYVRGIVSTTENNGAAALTSFTDISYYEGWIHEIIVQESSGDNCERRPQLPNSSVWKCVKKTECAHAANLPPNQTVICGPDKLCCPRPRPSDVFTKANKIASIMCNEYERYRRPHSTTMDSQANGEPEIITHELQCTVTDVLTSTGIGQSHQAVSNVYPHMALIGYDDNLTNPEIWRCGGSLISDQFILGISDCAKAWPGEEAKWAALGLLDRNDIHPDLIGQNLFRIIQRITHYEYRPGTANHDIALYKLENPIELSTSIRPICLYHPGRLRVDTKTYVTGWGEVYPGGSDSEVLLEAHILNLDPKSCATKYPNKSDEMLPKGFNVTTMICGGDPAAQIYGFCHGVSLGSPMQIRMPDKVCMWTQIGIASYGFSKCDEPTIYTRVSYYLPWIQNLVWPNVISDE